ncbi:MAG: M23 family metallopeptidase [Microbacterium sp.]
MTLDAPLADNDAARRFSPSAAALSGARGLTRAEFRRRAAAAAAESARAHSSSVDAAAVATSPEVAAPAGKGAFESAMSVEDGVTAASVPAASSATSLPVFSGSSVVDEFEVAARVFCFTGETPVSRIVEQAAAEEPAAEKPAAEEPAAEKQLTEAPAAPRRARRSRLAIQRVAAASFSVAAMAVVGMLAVATTTPAAALSSSTADLSATAAATSSSAEEIQALVASGGSDVESLDRPDGYDIASIAETTAETAAASGVTLFADTWTNDPDSNIQWPFPVGVPISAAYGSTSYLAQFSSAHNGVDLTPGEGAEIHVIAAGTVRIATEAGGDYGVTVVVDHIIDGELVSTRYAHMQYGSLQVAVGDTVEVGDVLGTVGQTGKATGPHLHFEVLLGGDTYTDPMEWMYEHTTGTHTVG